MDKHQLLKHAWQALGDKDPQRAITISNQLATKFPDFAPGWFAISHLAQLARQPRKSLIAIDRALKLDPTQVDWKLHRIACLLKCVEPEMAIRDLEFLVNEPEGESPLSPSQSTRLAFLCTRMGMHESAQQIYLKLTEEDPNNGGHWYNLATVQRFRGNNKAAESSLEKSIALNSNDYEAHALLADVRKQTPDNNHVKRLEALLARGIEEPAGEVRICYALAKELEDVGEYPRSFEVLTRGARVRRKHIEYRIDEDTETINAIRSTFDEQYFRDSRRGYQNAEPVFIIGLPRTGSTLLERILGSHSEVIEAGELNNFAQQMVRQIRERTKGSAMSRQKLVLQSAELDFQKLGGDYLQSTRPQTGHSRHFTDKMPLNFLYAGLIHRALPQAKILHMVRHPMDSCYAIYKKLFQDAYPWSYSLTEIADYYLAYQGLMDHWKSVLPGVIHDVKYEELISNLELQTRKILDHCNLGWESQCVKFHENPTASTTASASQVRQPVYLSSAGLWRNYEQELSTVANRLRDRGIDIQ